MDTMYFTWCVDIQYVACVARSLLIYRQSKNVQKTMKESVNSMDREIPRSVKMARKRMTWLRYGAIVVGLAAIGFGISRFFRSSVSEKSISVSDVDRGTIEVSVTASGRVVPAFEEAIVSPITARVVEVYKSGGDSVDVGTPLLKLDLQSTQTDYQNKLDELQMKRHQLGQLLVNNQTRLSDLEMQIRVSEMKLGRMEAELRNERYLVADISAHCFMTRWWNWRGSVAAIM